MLTTLEDPGGVEPLGARIKSPLPNRLGLERSGSRRGGHGWSSRTVTIRGLPVIGGVLCL